MATVLTIVLIGIGLLWYTRLVRQRLREERVLRILSLETQYWNALEKDDTAGADQIEVQLHDIPGSGWDKAGSGSGQRELPGDR